MERGLMQNMFTFMDIHGKFYREYRNYCRWFIFTESCFYVSIVDKSERGRYPDPKKIKEFSLSSKQLN